MNTNTPFVPNQKPSGICRPEFLTGRFDFKAKKYVRLWSAAALTMLTSCLAPQVASAATIGWGAATTIAGTNDVSTNGTALYAYAGLATTVNGAAFTAVSSGTTWGSITLSGFGSYAGNPTFGIASSPFSTLSTTYSNALTGAAYGGATAGTVTLNGLTVGHDYSVQIWVNDSRAAGNGRTETITGSGVTLDYNNFDAAGGVGQYSVGYFVADNTNQSFSLTPSASGSVQLNAISVRDIGVSSRTWLGGTDTSWGTAGNWTPANIPIFGDAIIFNNLSAANLSTVPDVSYTLSTLTLSNTASAISIGGANAMTVSGGINLIGVNQNLTITAPLVFSASQTWNVTNSSSTLAVNGGLSGGAVLTITGGGRVSIGGAATYTGGTIINSGRLAIASAGTLASTNITIAGGAIFDVSAESPNYALNGATFRASSPGAVINGTGDFSTGTISITYDGVNAPFIQTNGTLTLSGSTVINVNNTGAVLTSGNYTIIAAATAGNPGTVAGTLPGVNLTGNGAVGAVSLAINGTGGLDLVVGAADVWTGASNNSWANAGNWSLAAVPNPGDPVLFNNLSTANLNTVLNQDFFLAGVSILNPAGAVTIGGANNLGLSSIGINMQSATRDLTITAPVQVLADQQWNVTNNRTLNINGGASGGSGVTIVGAGVVNFNSAATYAGDTTVSSNSALKMTTANVLPNGPGTGNLNVNGSLDLNGNSEGIGALNGASGSLVDNTGGSAVTLTIGANGGAGIFRGIVKNTGGALALVVNGGNLAFTTSSNSYSGGTTFNSGATLGGTASASLGTGPVVFAAGANSYTTACTLTNVLSLDSCYLRVGGGNLNVQTWSGPVTVTNGIQMSGDGGVGGVTLSGPMNIGSGGLSVTNGGGNGPNEGFNVSLTGDLLSGAISGSGGITYYCNGGNSRLTVQGANTYSGGTIVNGTGNGKLNVWNSINPFSTGSVTLNAGAIIEAAPGSATITNALTLNGGTLESEAQFNNYNQLFWTGPITLTADSSFVQFATGALNNNQSSGVNVSGPLNINGFTLTCSSPVATFGGNTISGSISGAGNILENGNNILQLSGSNTFNGTIRSVLGTIGVGNVYAMQNATLDMNASDAGAVNLNNNNVVIGALTGSRNLSLGSGSVSIGNNNTTTVFTGSLSGSGNLTKIGSGTLSLSNNATTASVTVSTGTLVVGQPTFANSALAAVTVNSGAFLELDFDATNVVANLVLNGVGQTAGIYKAANSGGRITGIGAIQVVPPLAWSGASSTSWNTAANWANGTIPGSGSSPVFNAVSTANLNTVLNANFNLNTLQLANPTGPVSIAPGGAFALTLTNGIDMSQATKPLTITAPLVIGAAQAWIVSTNSGGLSISNLSGVGTVALTGGGTIVLNGTNTSTGNRVIQNGTTVRFAGTGTNAFQTSGTIYVTNVSGTGTIDLNGTTQTSPSYVSFPYSSTTTLTNGTLICNAAATGVPNANEDYNFMGTINLAPNGNYISNRRFLIGNAFNGFTMTVNSLNGSANGSLTWGGDNAGSMNYVGVAASQAGTLNITGGTVNFTNSTVGTGNGWLNVGANNASAKGTVIVSTGSLNVGTWLKMSSVFNTFAGVSATSILTITNNGSVNIGGGNAGTNGILFMGGGNGDATANTGVSTLNVANGGTLTVAQIQSGNNGTKAINFNGGTIVARPGATNNFLSAAPGLTVNIQNGGATINSGANSIAVAAALVANGTGGLTKTGTGALTLSGASTYTGSTIVSAGSLLVNNTTGVGTGTGAVSINSSGSLGGTGVIGGLVTNNAGGILSPGVAGVGTLTVTNKLTLLSGSTNTFVVNGTTAVASNSVAVGAAITSYGGVLNIVTNGTFTVGQTFQLFSGAGATNASNFASIAGSAGAGKNFSFANGILSVVSTGPSGSNLLTNSITGGGGTLSLSWGNGWTLQRQTNSLSNGLGNNWQTYVSGVAGITSTNISIDQTRPTVFYRLTYP
jgi:autotransporter-associated beta strand protein